MVVPMVDPSRRSFSFIPLSFPVRLVPVLKSAANSRSDVRVTLGGCFSGCQVRSEVFVHSCPPNCPVPNDRAFAQPDSAGACIRGVPHGKRRLGVTVAPRPQSQLERCGCRREGRVGVRLSPSKRHDSGVDRPPRCTPQFLPLSNTVGQIDHDIPKPLVEMNGAVGGDIDLIGYQ
jgi:hypothetical protein